MPRSLDLDSVVTAVADQHWRRLSDEAVILSGTTGMIYGLNATGAQIWELAQQRITVRALRDHLVERFEVEPQTCLRELLALLEQLTTQGLIEVCAAPAPPG